MDRMLIELHTELYIRIETARTHVRDEEMRRQFRELVSNAIDALEAWDLERPKLARILGIEPTKLAEWSRGASAPDTAKMRQTLWRMSRLLGSRLNSEG